MEKEKIEIAALPPKEIESEPMKGPSFSSLEHFFNCLTASELIDYKKLTDILYDFYDNEMKIYANDAYVSPEYEKASHEAAKYLRVKEEIFNEIKKRIDFVYEKTLAKN